MNCGEWSGETVSISKAIGDFTSGWFDDGSYLPSLLSQLRERIYQRPVKGSREPSSGGKPKSKPPLDVVALDFYDASKDLVCSAQTGDRDAERELLVIYHQVRRYLGYEQRMVLLEKVCGACGSQLIVAEDASSDVYCTASDCDVIYLQQDWIALLYVNDDVT